jgi:hypothetical protein
MSDTEEYKLLDRGTFTPPGPNPPTQLIEMKVQKTNDPPTPVPKVKVMRSDRDDGKGFEFEVSPSKPTFAQVYLSNGRFEELRTNLKNKKCRINLRYQSTTQTGNDGIFDFEPIYSFS